jgi:peptidoglycan/LPS O-acetylase OafA/YrhL
VPRTSALRAPATRDQADAYRFGLRRMEAALVRGDPVPLHEQIRSQRRAALAGVVLGLLGLCGAAVWAVLVPSPEWRREAVVIGATSGVMYAVAHDPDRLVPRCGRAGPRAPSPALQ